MGAWGHDRVWEHDVVERIRRGGPAPLAFALHDNISQEYWGERTGLGTGVIYYDAKEAEERALKNKEFRESLRAAQETAKARKAKEAEERKARAKQQAEDRRAWKAERAAQYDQWTKEAEQRRAQYIFNRPTELAEKMEHLNQENRILLSRWSCTICGGKSKIERKNPGYQITCLECGKSAWGSHQSLWEVLSR